MSALIELNTVAGQTILKKVAAGVTTTRELKENILTTDDFPGCCAVAGIAMKPPVSMIQVFRESGEIMQDCEVVLELSSSMQPENEPLASLMLVVVQNMEFQEMRTFLGHCPYISFYAKEHGHEPRVPLQVIEEFCCFFYQCALKDNFGGQWASTVFWNYTPSVLKDALRKSFPGEALQYIGLY